jgi:hypothetical protein
MKLDLPLLDVDMQLLLRLQKELLFGLDSVGEAKQARLLTRRSGEAKIPIHKKLRRSFGEEERASPTRIAKVNSSWKSRIRIRSTFGDPGPLVEIDTLTLPPWEALTTFRSLI